MKYIVWEDPGGSEHVVMFGPELEHNVVARMVVPTEAKYHKLVSAGFCDISDNTDKDTSWDRPSIVSTYGRSLSLNLEVRKGIDAELLSRTVNARCTSF